MPVTLSAFEGGDPVHSSNFIKFCPDCLAKFLFVPFASSAYTGITPSLSPSSPLTFTKVSAVTAASLREEKVPVYS